MAVANRLAVPLAILAFCFPVCAQQTNRQSPPRNPPPRDQELGVSELERGNLMRVAASPAQVREILIKEPGIMVELKTWIAKEASDNGQIVNDENLTDNAVFERLDGDVAFRSIATRMLQRYGYLRPGVNPDSEIGKQQDLIIKERVRRLVQIEATEDAQAANPAKAPIASEAKNAYCDPSEKECPAGAGSNENRSISAPSDTSRTPGPPFNAPNDGLPLTPIPRILQANGNASGMSDMSRMSFSQSPDETGAFQNASGPSRSNQDLPLMNGGSQDLLSGSLLDQLRAGGASNSGGAYSNDEALREASSASGAKPESGAGVILRHDPRLAKERDVSAAVMVHRPNPYADIPSMYDLYVQAPARDRPPQRFGTEIFRDGLRDLKNLPIDLPVGPDYVVGPGDSLVD